MTDREIKKLDEQNVNIVDSVNELITTVNDLTERVERMESVALPYFEPRLTNNQ